MELYSSISSLCISSKILSILLFCSGVNVFHFRMSEHKYIQASWKEGKKKYKDVVPREWIKEQDGVKVLFWPNGKDPNKLMILCTKPDPSWQALTPVTTKDTCGMYTCLIVLYI